MFGTGYVGLVTGTCFAEMGNDVLCLDIDEDKVASLRAGSVPIFEPGLEAMVAANYATGRLDFTTDTAAAIDHGEILFIAVGTPADEAGAADLQYVLAVARSIGEHMREPKLIVDKSTVPVGTADKVRETVEAALDARGETIDFDVVSNPEFLKEGAAINDFMKPDRVVIGANRAESARRLEALYAPFNRNHDKVVHMDVRSAELTKYAANVMLATRISLMNELANLAERLGADIEAVRRGIGTDPRIGYHFIYPGTGYGGSCFPKDVKALIRTGDEVGYGTTIVKAVEDVNDEQKGVLVTKILRHFDGDVAGKRFALWGLAFKPNTDDMREAPAQVIIERLVAAGATVVAYDPQARDEAQRIFDGNNAVTIVDSREATLDGADGLIVATEWNEFRSPDFNELKARLSQPVIFDGRNLYDPIHLGLIGIAHYGIGRPSAG